MHRGDDAVGCPLWLCRWQRDRRDALTWQGAERSPCGQGATRAAQGPDPGLCLPSPQVRPHVTDFADPLPPAGSYADVVLATKETAVPAAPPKTVMARRPRPFEPTNLGPFHQTFVG